MTRIAIRVLGAAAATLLAATVSSPADDVLESRTVARLQEYVRIDTSNPPGEEIRAARFFAGILEEAGIPYEIAESAPGRGNIWARLEGGDEPALLLLHHMDVVPADRAHWSVDPFAAEIRDGYLYGRGALDTKTSGILHLEAFLELARSHRQLRRDVIFMGTADEEAGGFFGAGWLVENRPELFEDVGFVLNEGGGGTRDGSVVSFDVEVTQKVPLWLRLVAVDEPGHGSRPRVSSAVTRLVRALGNVADYDFEPRIVPAVDAYFKALAETSEPPWDEAFADVDGALRDPSLLLRLQLEKPGLHALTRNTCSITMLEGSRKINVVPPEAAAQLDCRLLPDQDPDAFVEKLSGIVNDPRIRIERIMGFTPAVSPSDTELFRALERVSRRHYPEARVFPGVLTGFTDSHFFRDLGIVAYGYEAVVVPREDGGRVHGNDERVSVKSVRRGVRMTLEIIEEFALESPREEQR